MTASIATSVIQNLRTENQRFRDKLSELADECSECNGAGVVTLEQSLRAIDAGKDGEQQQPCPACEDIRELLQ